MPVFFESQPIYLMQIPAGKVKSAFLQSLHQFPKSPFCFPAHRNIHKGQTDAVLFHKTRMNSAHERDDFLIEFFADFQNFFAAPGVGSHGTHAHDFRLIFFENIRQHRSESFIAVLRIESQMISQRNHGGRIAFTFKKCCQRPDISRRIFAQFRR